MPVTEEQNINWRDAYNQKHEYSVQLEHERSSLWRVNEDLREKIGALERGQLALQEMLSGSESSEDKKKVGILAVQTLQRILGMVQPGEMCAQGDVYDICAEFADTAFRIAHADVARSKPPNDSL